MSDLIDRADAIKHIKAYRDEFKEDFDVDSEEGDDASHHFGYIAGLNRATRIIERLSSAEPRKGRWIFSRYFVWECSECGKSPTRGMGYTQRKDELFKYCPNCGAKMEVSE